MLKSIKIDISMDRCKNLPKKIEFDAGINVIIGDNGVGKSTLLMLLRESSGYRAKLDYEKGSSYTFFDFETMNPRMTEPNPNDQDLYVGGLLSRFRSHGEVSLDVLSHIDKCKEDVIILDEPDSNLFITRQLNLIKKLKKAAKIKETRPQCFV